MTPSADVRVLFTSESENRRSRTWPFQVFIALLAWQIVLVWIFQHFASQDGPSHLYNAALIRGFHDPAWHRVSEFYQLNSRLVPNWFTYVVLVGLSYLFSPATAEKMLVTGYFVFFPLSFVYVLRTLTKDVWYFAIWGLVFANNLFIAMGFYNFCYGLVFFLLCFGYWMKWRDRFGPKQLVTLCVLASLLYFSHAFVFFLAAFFIGVVALCFGLADSHSLAEKGVTRSGHTISTLLKRVLVPQLAFLPCLAIFFVSSTGSQPGTNPETPNFLRRLLVFHELYVLVDSKGLLGILRVFLVGSVLLWGFYLAITNAVKQRKLVACDGLGLLAAACLFLYVVFPWSLSGGGYIPERLAWFSLCGALLWLSSKEWTIKARQVVMGVSTLVVVFGLIGQASWRHQLSRVLNAYDVAGRLLVPQKTILSLCYCNPESHSWAVLADLRFRPLEHAGDIAALEGRDFSVDNYEATGSTFPLEYNPTVNPALHSKTFAASTSKRPQKTDIADYEAQTGESIDYVLIWGTGLGDWLESGSILDQQLRSNYEEIYTSASPALLRLFKRR